jgi:uncharacterized membrane protein YccC
MPLALDRNAETALAFVLRCSGACTLAYEFAYLIGLRQPLWAAISAIVVSQERLGDTRASLTSRIAGTVLGVAVSLAVGACASTLGLSSVAQMAIAVAIAAYAAHRFAKVRVAMWTCAVVLLTAKPSEALFAVALQRATEVIFGAAIGFAFHWCAEKLFPATAAPEDSQG